MQAKQGTTLKHTQCVRKSDSASCCALKSTTVEVPHPCLNKGPCLRSAQTPRHELLYCTTKLPCFHASKAVHAKQCAAGWLQPLRCCLAITAYGPQELVWQLPRRHLPPFTRHYVLLREMKPPTMPLGPSVDFTRSVIAIAPTKAACEVHELIQRGLSPSAACALCSRQRGGKVVFRTCVPCVRLILCPPWPLLVKHLAVAPSAVRGANTGPTFCCCLWAPSACCCRCQLIRNDCSAC